MPCVVMMFVGGLHLRDRQGFRAGLEVCDLNGPSMVRILIGGSRVEIEAPR